MVADILRKNKCFNFPNTKCIFNTYEPDLFWIYKLILEIESLKISCESFSII